jgi:hypothetical protein
MVGVTGLRSSANRLATKPPSLNVVALRSSVLVDSWVYLLLILSCHTTSEKPSGVRCELRLALAGQFPQLLWERLLRQ